MLEKQLRLKKKTDFSNVFSLGKSVSNKYFTLYLYPNNLDNCRFAFSISKKVSKKAVVRNKIKRRLKHICKLEIENLLENFDCVLIIRKKIVDIDFLDCRKKLVSILKTAKVYKYREIT